MKNKSPLLRFSVMVSIFVSAIVQQPNSTLNASSLPYKPLLTSSQDSLENRIGELSKQISDGLTENQKRTIAVVEFVDLRGNVTDFGRFVSEELITRLYQTKKFNVIERQLLNKVITEQKLSLTGMIDQSSAQKLGQVLGVDAIASGTVTDLGKTLRINARLIGTGTGQVFAVAATEITKDESVLTLIGSGITGPTNNSSTALPGSGPSNASNSSSANPFQDFPEVRVEVERLRITVRQAIVTLTYVNKTNKELSLALNQPLGAFANGDTREIPARVSINDQCSGVVITRDSGSIKLGPTSLGRTYLLDSEGNRHELLYATILGFYIRQQCWDYFGQDGAIIKLLPQGRETVTLTFDLGSDSALRKSGKFEIYSDHVFVQKSARSSAPIAGTGFNVSIANISVDNKNQ